MMFYPSEKQYFAHDTINFMPLMLGSKNVSMAHVWNKILQWLP